jgi:hypothetical protein
MAPFYDERFLKTDAAVLGKSTAAMWFFIVEIKPLPPSSAGRKDDAGNAWSQAFWRPHRPGAASISE